MKACAFTIILALVLCTFQADDQVIVTIEDVNKSPSKQPLYSLPPIEKDIATLLQTENSTTLQSIKTRIMACTRIARMELLNEREKFFVLKDLHRTRAEIIKQKLLAAMISACFHSISLNDAEKFLKDGLLNTSLPLKFPFNDYNSPDADIDLTRDEEFVMRLANITERKEVDDKGKKTVGIYKWVLALAWLLMALVVVIYIVKYCATRTNHQDIAQKQYRNAIAKQRIKKFQTMPEKEE